MMPPVDRPHFSQDVVAQPDDIDELGHVSNIVYVRWIQDIATAHWRAVARPEDIARYVWMVTRHEIDYARATLEGEAVTLITWVGTPHGARFDRFVEISGADGKMRASATTVWALVDAATRRALRIPAAVAAPFLKREN